MKLQVKRSTCKKGIEWLTVKVETLEEIGVADRISLRPEDQGIPSMKSANGKTAYLRGNDILIFTSAAVANGYELEFTEGSTTEMYNTTRTGIYFYNTKCAMRPKRLRSEAYERFHEAARLTRNSIGSGDPDDVRWFMEKAMKAYEEISTLTNKFSLKSPLPEQFRDELQREVEAFFKGE